MQQHLASEGSSDILFETYTLNSERSQFDTKIILIAEGQEFEIDAKYATKSNYLNSAYLQHKINDVFYAHTLHTSQ